MLRDDERKWLAEAEAAWCGPWREWDRIESSGNILITDEDGMTGVCRVIENRGTLSEHTPDSLKLGADECRANATFISSSRTAVPTLCHRLRAAREVIDETQKLCMERGQRLDAMAEALRERMLNSWHSPTCALQRKLPCDCGVDAWCRKAAKLLEGRGT